MKILFFLVSGKPYILAATLKDGDILLLRSYDDVIPQVSFISLQKIVRP